MCFGELLDMTMSYVYRQTMPLPCILIQLKTCQTDLNLIKEKSDYHFLLNLMSIFPSLVKAHAGQAFLLPNFLPNAPQPHPLHLHIYTISYSSVRMSGDKQTNKQTIASKTNRK